VFTIVDHSADIAVDLQAANRVELFRSALQSICALLTKGIPEVKEKFRDTFGI